MRTMSRHRIMWIAVAGACAVAATSAIAASPLPLTGRVLKNGYAGMRPAKPPVVVKDANTWADGQTGYLATLRREGFVGGIQEQLSTPGNGNRFGISLVEQLASPAGAAAELKSDYTENGPWTRFAVSRIPDAVGFETKPPGGKQGGRNVGFTVGPYFYLVGAGWQGGARNAVPRATVIAAAQKLYDQVR
jgi:hypothetical protein